MTSNYRYPNLNLFVASYQYFMIYVCFCKNKYIYVVYDEPYYINIHNKQKEKRQRNEYFIFSDKRLFLIYCVNMASLLLARLDRLKQIQSKSVIVTLISRNLPT